MQDKAGDSQPSGLPKSTILKTVFWPSTIKNTGYLYGWTLAENVTCVAGVIHAHQVS